MPGDMFLLDGEGLLACADVQNPENSPSCSTPVSSGAVAYTARNENYQRIRRRGTNGNFTWEVTAKDGTIFEYREQAFSNPRPKRTYLSEVRDPNGNMVKLRLGMQRGECKSCGRTRTCRVAMCN